MRCDISLTRYPQQAHGITKIMGLALGEFKGVACFNDPGPTRARFTTVHTDPQVLRKLLHVERPGLVDFETCTIAGRVADSCDELVLANLIAEPMHEAWSGRKLKRQSVDRTAMSATG